MGGPAYDCLTNPLGAVRFSFVNALSSGYDPASSVGKDWGVLDLFHHYFSDESAISQVPILDSSSIKWVQPNTLVRFRGMIQDMLGNEFYAGAYKDGSTWRTNKYSDVSQSPQGVPTEMQVWERRLLYCIPVPGQNQWTECSSQELKNRLLDLTGQNREKRVRVDEEMTDSMESNTLEAGLNGSPFKKMKVGEATSSASETQVPQSAGIPPATSTDSLPCLVKIYDSPESELKLNDVVEFLGVLTFDSNVMMDMDSLDENTDDLADAESVQLPSKNVPRLHCLIHRKLETQHFLHGPLLLTEPKSPQIFKEIRESLMKYLTGLLGNDHIAAQFLLLHLLSKVHGRVDNVAVGKLSLNLIHLNKESMSIFGNQLSDALKNLLPFSQSIPLTIEYLNTASLGPKKDYRINRLVPGVLQIADGTHLILDETELQPGTLNSVGVENAKLLKNLLECQKVEYDFQYYKMEMATDVQMLIFSEGKSNIMPADLVLPFQPSQVNSLEAITPETAEAWRCYLATCKSLAHSIGQELQQVVENDLVAARQTDRSLGSQDLSRLLTMARMMSVSYGETTLSLEHWQMVLELERLRKERIKAARSIKRRDNSLYNALRSIYQDSIFVHEISQLWPKLPLLANLRCGLWYSPRFDTTCYFKSTDGHTNNLSFNTSRLNLHLPLLAGEKGGCIIIDSTRKGNRFPDSMSKTIPIWSCVLNRSIFNHLKRLCYNDAGLNSNDDHDGDNIRQLLDKWDCSLHLPLWVSNTERASIEARLDEWTRQLDESGADIVSLASCLRKPLRPLWVSQKTVIWLNEVPDHDSWDFTPLILVSASVSGELQHGTNSEFSWNYIPGAGDDEESWARGLSPNVFWTHVDDLIHSGPDFCNQKVAEIVENDRVYRAQRGQEAPQVIVKCSKSNGGVNHGKSDEILSLSAPQPKVGMTNADKESLVSWLASTNLAVGASQVAGKVTSIDCILNCDQNPISVPESYLEEHLHLPMKGSKFDRFSISRNLASAVNFAKLKMSLGKKLLVCCQDGEDISVCVCLAILISLFNEEGAFDGGKSFEEKSMTKLEMRRMLIFICKHAVNARPSRGNLRQVFGFLSSHHVSENSDE